MVYFTQKKRMVETTIRKCTHIGDMCGRKELHNVTFEQTSHNHYSAKHNISLIHLSIRAIKYL